MFIYLYLFTELLHKGFSSCLHTRTNIIVLRFSISVISYKQQIKTKWQIRPFIFLTQHIGLQL